MNAGVNSANSTGTNDCSKFLMISYGLALFSSIGTGMLMKKMFINTKNLSVMKEALIRIIPSCMAGFLNAFFMRSDYITNGIVVKDEQGRDLGLSKTAGVYAVMESSISRFFIPLPGLFSIFILRGLAKFKLSRNKDVGLQLILCILHLGMAVPASIAIFKQYGEIPIASLEADCQENAKKLESRKAIYNKGL